MIGCDLAPSHSFAMTNLSTTSEQIDSNKLHCRAAQCKYPRVVILHDFSLGVVGCFDEGGDWGWGKYSFFASQKLSQGVFKR